MERLLTIPEVASLLTVSRRTIEGFIANGKLRVVRLSARCVRVRPTDLRSFVSGRMERRAGEATIPARKRGQWR